MSDPSYLPGSWFAVVSPRAVVLLDDSLSPSRLQAVWDTCNGEPSLDELIEVVTGGRFVGAPFFGIALVDGTGLRVVVRTGVTAVIGESVGTARSVVSGNANTWVEENLEQPQPVRLVRDAPPSQALTLPVTGGIVLADEVTWAPVAVPVLAPVPASAAVPAVASGRRVALATTPIPTSSPALDGYPAAPDYPSPSSPPDPADSEWSVWALDEAGELAGGGDPAAESAEPAEVPEPGVVPVSSLRPSLASSVPPLLPEAQPESPFEPPSELDAEAGRAGQAPVVDGYLHFSTGLVVPLDRPVIVGRSPAIDRLQRADNPRPVKIDNLDQDISRNHVEIRPEGGRVLAFDLNSANGTIVTIPGRMAQRLAPHEPFLMLLGSVVTLSDDIYFSYEDSESPAVNHHTRPAYDLG